LIYLDPPYEGTTDYGEAFNSKFFWDTVREWSKITVVVVSEYEAPDDFECIASQEKKCCISGGDKQTTRIEKLFIHTPSLEHHPALARRS
jgi:DNA adenine methylase